MIKQAFRPIGDRIIVRRADPETVSRGGILIPGTTEKPAQGVVVATGPGKTLEGGILSPLSLKVGDSILFGQHSGTEVIVDGDSLLVMREEDVMAVVEGAI